MLGRSRKIESTRGRRMRKRWAERPVACLAEAPEVQPETRRLDLARKCPPYLFAALGAHPRRMAPERTGRYQTFCYVAKTLLHLGFVSKSLRRIKLFATYQKSLRFRCSRARGARSGAGCRHPAWRASWLPWCAFASPLAGSGSAGGGDGSLE